jgi:hypothetical protein
MPVILNFGGETGGKTSDESLCTDESLVRRRRRRFPLFRLLEIRSKLRSR